MANQRISGSVGNIHWFTASQSILVTVKSLGRCNVHNYNGR